MRIFGALLAGGAASRMGGVAKPLLEVGGRTMAERALAPLRGHVDRLFISTNQPDLYDALGLETVTDGRAERLGPLAGLAALHQAIRRETRAPFRLLTVPGDTPFLPDDLAPRLLDPVALRVVRVAAFEGRLQPTVALWPSEALEPLAAWLDGDGSDLSIRRWIGRYPCEIVDFPPCARSPGGDPFFNVNTPGDLALAQTQVQNRET